MIAFGATNIQPSNANAVTTPTAAELEKLRKGHSRIKFLLENWDSETQVCGKITMSDTERKQVVRTEGKLENSGSFPVSHKTIRSTLIFFTGAGSGGCEKTPLKGEYFRVPTMVMQNSP